MGLAPTGKQVTFRGIQMQRISNGRIEEEWAGFNTLGAFQEIGALPPLGQPAVAAR
jgi:predicted ester cyclase